MSTAICREPVRRLAMVRRERVFRYERGATHGPTRVKDCQFALGFETANLRKNRQTPETGVRATLADMVLLSTMKSVVPHQIADRFRAVLIALLMTRSNRSDRSLSSEMPVLTKWAMHLPLDNRERAGLHKLVARIY
jgi:hypothetical protein